MIVVDTNVMAYLFIPGDRTAQARAALLKDPAWIAPLLWRSEFRNVLASYINGGHLNLNQALLFMHEAEMLFTGGEYQVESVWVLNLVASSQCSAYDCEFVALAQNLGVTLVTTDRQVLKKFPSSAISLEAFSDQW